MPQKIEGGCQCGAVRYTSAADPMVTFNCHCTHCQQASGAPFTTAVAVNRGDVTVSGDTIEHTQTSDLGTPVHRFSCKKCGAYVYGISDGFGALAVNAVTLDDASWVEPQMEVYTSSAQPWTHMNPALPQFDKLPPMDEG